MDLFSLKNKVIVITGATSGIGRRLAIACAEAGAVVAALGRSSEKMAELKDALKQYPANHYFECFDATEYDLLPDVVSRIVHNCGKISGFIHCAGVVNVSPLLTTEIESFFQLYAINAVSGFAFAKEICRKKNISPSASFVFISSICAIRGEASMLAYSASKGAVLSGARCMAAELSKKGIRVNTIIPGLINDTPMGENTVSNLTDESREALQSKHVLGKGVSSDLIGAVIFLLSDASRWITGSSLSIDGGYTL